jgi:hypothetical protein
MRLHFLKCILDISQPHRSPQPVTGRALLFCVVFIVWNVSFNVRVALYAVFCLSVMCHFVWYVNFCVLCLIVVPLSQEHTFLHVLEPRIFICLVESLRLHTLLEGTLITRIYYRDVKISAIINKEAVSNFLGGLYCALKFCLEGIYSRHFPVLLQFLFL